MSKKATRAHVMAFGKYKGMTLTDIADQDPSYIVWMDSNKVLDMDAKLVSECMADSMEGPDWMIGLEHEMGD